MNEDTELNFSELVRKRLESQGEEAALELWLPLAEGLDRDGPDAAMEYINAEQQSLKQLVENRLKQLEEE